MNIAEKPIAMIQGRRSSTGDGVHLIANHYPRGTRLDTHTHREAQLVYAARGTMQVTTPKGRWLVPPDRAVWVPAHLAHAIDVLADIDMRTLYFDPAWLAREQRGTDPSHEFVVRVSPLLHETILALFEGRLDGERSTLLIRLAMLELQHAEDSTTFVPLPREPRCRRAASIVLADPTARHEIEALARAVGTSGRTLSRLFATETQLSFKSWCQRARIAAAIERLSTDANVSIKQVASELGYASLPAFSHAFRQVTGRTPSGFGRKDWLSQPA
ncbi:MAG TPA: helix-turn-helix transcriptional regulator [Bradyrhizobium sp.]|uniref:AraC family transcriptional regulator n=1 Tax=Bradyrhizobium sp. TaxID=376 RepID=UPI002D7E4544|nr:helix-turn-helix transcriptional regulator [Bradyrhizobium sp.]HET7887860.1 helix-turn-helix transcriptional regulator [Bradyrhizobium sp.]